LLTIIAYDIPDDSRRNKVAKCLEDYGRRIQFSVFEIDVPDHDYRDMRERLTGIIDHDEDQIRFFPICEACVKRSEVEGKEDDGGWPDVIII
jgi:CRISPR-associated protein Cas2